MKLRIIIVGFSFIFNLCYGEVINRVIAVVNGEVVTESDLINYAFRLTSGMDREKLDQESKDKILKRALQNLIEDKLILSYGKRLKLDVNKSEIERRISQLKKDFDSEVEFLNALEQDGLSYQNLYQRLHDDILKKRVVDLFVRKKIEIHPQELKDYYDNHRDEFFNLERIRVRKIYLKKGEGVEEKVKQIEELLYKNVSFEDLALNYSDAETIYLAEGEWIEKGKLRKDIDELIFALDVGQISSIVQTETGYYIFQVLEKSPFRFKGFEEVKDKIYEIIYGIKFREKFQVFIESLKKDAQIDIKI